MEENIKKTEVPLETLANISDQFTLLKYERLDTEVKIKLESLDYMDLIRDVENITNVGTDPDSKMFSIDIDNVKFIFTRD
jgi:hypothetical protein|tara:strand:- start:1572 stop:1811 length:240 start_codon:yes stop_codon:yes gene_type:complete